MRPHRRQPNRLPHPWDSPGKNTGVGCHFRPQCMKMKSESEATQLCPTLSDPMDCSLPGSSVHGSFQARVLSGLPLPSPEEIASLYHSIVFLYFFAFFPEESFLFLIRDIPAFKNQRRQWRPTPVLLPGKSHGQRSLVGCNLWSCKKSDMTE